MKIDAKTKILLICIVGILAVIASVIWIANPMKEKTAALEAENAGLKVTADEYQAVNAQRAIYEQGKVDLTARREELLSNFPAGMTREDEIMYWANMERENASTLAIANLVMSGWEEVHVAGEPEVVPGTEEEGATQLHLYKAPVNYTYQATYDGVKNMVEYVFAQDDKKSIRGISVSYDTTSGNLLGTLDMDMYYMVGTGNTYEPMTIPSVPTGITNPFRSSDTLVLENEHIDESSDEEAAPAEEENNDDKKSDKKKK